MLATAIETLLAVLESIAPNAIPSVVVKIIIALETWVPIIAQEYQALKRPVLNVIAALRGNGDVTPDQLDQLDVVEAKLDADFDASSAAADAEDAAGSK